MFFLLILIALFSVLTLVRTKFGGVDLDRGVSVSVEGMLYSVFAESNVVFPLISILDIVEGDDGYIYLQPVFDAVLELVPKVLVPWRQTGGYIEDVLGGLLVEEAISSGTAYPYVGELILMGGWVALAFGVLLLSYVSMVCIRYASVLFFGQRLRDCAYGMIAVYFAYYFFSRGYLAQSVKGFLFVLLPYMIGGLVAWRRVSSAKI
jgi:hypothetical protein